MIDPNIKDKVVTVAIAAANRSRRVDLSKFWTDLSKIDLEKISCFLATSPDKYSYGAIPLVERPDSAITCTSEPIETIGVDGSQVYPSSQDPVRWSYIQALAYAKSSPPYFLSDFRDIGSSNFESMRSDVSFDGVNGSESVDFWRTLLELRVAVQIAGANSDRVILMDYPLLPWINAGNADYRTRVQEYIGLIEALKGTLVAGVVSAPKSRLLLNLIALSHKTQGEDSQLADITDDILICYGLKPGERSAVFTYAGPRNEVCKARGVEIGFFFIRIKDYDVARVEIPSWLMNNPTMIDKIHASILNDSLALGYPYVLAAAHQMITVSLDIAESLHRLATATFVRAGGFYTISAKMRAKGIK